MRQFSAVPAPRATGTVGANGLTRVVVAGER